MDTPHSVAAAWRSRLVEKTLPAALGKATAHLARLVADEAPVETGDLRDSVHASPVRSRPGRLSSAVVVSSEHALDVEYGTERMDAEPFLRPAIRAGLPRAVAIVRAAVR